MPPEEHPDTELLRRWLKRDPKADKEFNRTLRAEIRRFMLRRFPPWEADDRTQETLCGFLESSASSPNFAPTRVYLFGVAHNVARKRRRGWREQYIDPVELFCPDPSTPSQKVALGMRDLSRALTVLREEELKVLELYYAHQMTFAEVAQVIGSPASTIRGLGPKIKRKLKGKLPENFLDILKSSDDENADLELKLEELFYTLDRLTRERGEEHEPD
ncbi:RNA polymerase sigma factor [Pseudenhygromyxa sp. WMMC2535]|uniref:RNA polymerase sigma factor n=1 Tax=Pseudenhygromyxa sp. WMMC2535 TaxID=2712867 RepID=UPI0015542621|nr:RNA polymerase sigma factor [Pseudenhygromyxa sp. WMMC2535]NVB39815.1 RNA polymerase sigma factor [Pseudenhygromyxa sp. WMMC2535]